MSAVAAGQRPAARGGLLTALGDEAAALCVVLTFALSAFTLQSLGINYLVEGGSQLQKVHPATWMAMLAFVLHSLRGGNPVTQAAIMSSRFPGAAIFIVILIFTIAYNVLVQKAPVALYLDTFLAPALMLWLLCDLPERTKRRLRLFLHVFMFVNACLGLYELRTGFRLTPYVVVGTEIETETSDWRASALLGHPLANSTTSAIYILALVLRREMPAGRRMLLIVVQIAAMNAFGGRAATLMALVALAAVGGWKLLDIARGARFSLQAGAVVMVAVPVSIATLLLLYEAGFFDPFLARFSQDGNSAKARLLMFTLFKHMSLDTFLFGSNAETVMTHQYVEGFEYGIESFWIASVVSQGLVMSLLLWAGMFIFFRDLVRATSRRTLAVLALAIAIASTSLSLGGKSSMLALLVSFALLFLEDGRIGKHKGL